MPKQNYYEIGQLTDVAYLVLLALVEPRHGYSIMNEITAMTKGRENIGPASLYTTLRKLTAAGFIDLIGNDAGKKTYLITENGLLALTTEVEKRERLAKYGLSALKRNRKEKS